MKRHIEDQISKANASTKNWIKTKQEAEDEISASLEYSGLSKELYDLYMAFCGSLDPEFGQRGGFSIICNTNHKSSYIKYDPEFAIFKDCIEMPYDHCNFRCEASVEKDFGDYVVEF